MVLARELDTAASRLLLDAPIALDTHEPQGLRAAFFEGRSENVSAESPVKSFREVLKPEKGSSAALALKGLDVVAKVSMVMLCSSRPYRGSIRGLFLEVARCWHCAGTPHIYVLAGELFFLTAKRAFFQKNLTIGLKK